MQFVNMNQHISILYMSWNMYGIYFPLKWNKQKKEKHLDFSIWVRAFN